MDARELVMLLLGGGFSFGGNRSVKSQDLSYSLIHNWLDDKLPSVQVGVYQVSILLIMIVIAASSIVVTAAWYLFATSSVPLIVEEPLSISDYPDTFHVHPGENKTLDVVILNSASINYEVTLVFALNDSAYQESYVSFSNLSYDIIPGSNNITAWLFIQSGANPAFLGLTISFYRQ